MEAGEDHPRQYAYTAAATDAGATHGGTTYAFAVTGPEYRAGTW